MWLAVCAVGRIRAAWMTRWPGPAGEAVWLPHHATACRSIQPSTSRSRNFRARPTRYAVSPHSFQRLYNVLVGTSNRLAVSASEISLFDPPILVGNRAVLSWVLVASRPLDIRDYL